MKNRVSILISALILLSTATTFRGTGEADFRTWRACGRSSPRHQSVKPETETALESLLLDPDGPVVAAIGGGHGQAAALEAIQTYALRKALLIPAALSEKT